MKITKVEDTIYELEHAGTTIRTLKLGSTWIITGDTPPMLIGRFLTIDAVAKALTMYADAMQDMAAIKNHPLIDSPPEPSPGDDILADNMRWGLPPSHHPSDAELTEQANLAELRARKLLEFHNPGEDYGDG